MDLNLIAIKKLRLNEVPDPKFKLHLGMFLNNLSLNSVTKLY